MPPRKKPDYFLPRSGATGGSGASQPGKVTSRFVQPPLVDGKAIFEAFERAVLGAKSYVLIAFWAFDVLLPLQSREARKHGKNWIDLLTHVADKGVKVRLIMADFDPFLFHEAHARAWLRYRVATTALAKRRIKKENFQVLVARHPARIGSASTTMLGLSKVHELVAKKINSDPRARERRLVYACAPGVWDQISFDSKTETLVPKSKILAPEILPAVHHQKLVVVDGTDAFVGGINIVEPNLDTTRHLRTPLPWHDIFAHVQSGVSADIKAEFVRLWNVAQPAMEAFLNGANKVASPGFFLPTGTTSTLAASTLKDRKVNPGGRRVTSQIQTTLSQDGISMIPKVVNRGALDGYLKAISQAKKFIYVENQYFRSKDIADALLAQHAKVKSLRTIIVLPAIAEELIKGNADAISLHGAALQHENIDRLQKALGTRIGIYSLARGSNQIYVHSKLLLIDDQFCNIGSTNANPRSFLVDTELNLAWQDPASVKRARLILWREHLGSRTPAARWAPLQFVAEWNRIASRNVGLPPHRRRGRVLPFDNTAKGLKSKLIPDEFANIMTPGDLPIA